MVFSSGARPRTSHLTKVNLAGASCINHLQIPCSQNIDDWLGRNCGFIFQFSEDDFELGWH